MSLKADIEKLSEEHGITDVRISKDEVVHGEPGRLVRISGKALWIEIFFADSRKIDDAHALAIVESYLHHITNQEEGVA